MKQLTQSQVVRRVSPNERNHDLLVLWQDPIGRKIMPIGRLTYDSGLYKFAYIPASEDAFNAGFRGLPGLRDKFCCYQSASLFTFFAQRSVDPQQPTFERHLSRLGLGEDAAPLEQIVHSGGRRAADTIQLLEIPRITQNQLSSIFLVHGVRHVPKNEFNFENESFRVGGEEHERGLRELEANPRISLRPEPGNPQNPRAIVMTSVSGIPLGYVPDALVHGVHEVLNDSGLSVTALKVNGPDAPVHQRVVAQLKVAPFDAPNPFERDDWAIDSSLQIVMR